MKKIIASLAILLIAVSSFAAVSVIQPKLDAARMYFPVGKTGQKISLLELSQIKVKDMEALTGHKMDLFDRMSFGMAQKKVRNMIDADGMINAKKLQKYSKRFDGESGFHLGGFALGLFLGPIGVLIAYLLNDDFKHNRVKWAWIGFGVVVVLDIILFVAVINSIN